MNKKIKAPYLSSENIRQKVNKFRVEYWDESVPVDIEKIIESKLKIDIIPIPNLLDSCNSDALITSDWSSIYVDSAKYMDDRYQDRLRFSLAHEIGHFILHKEIYASFGIKSYTDFYNFFEKIDPQEYSYFEIQANKFASCLLIPEDMLEEERNKVIKDKKIDVNSFDEGTLNSYLAIEISDKFGVSEVAIEFAFKRK